MRPDGSDGSTQQIAMRSRCRPPPSISVIASCPASLLLPAFLPFNLLKAGLNASVTFLLYKPVVTALRKSGFVPAGGGQANSRPAGLLLAAALVAVSCVLFILAWNDVI